MNAANPADQKKLGKQVQGHTVEEWGKVSFGHMKEGVLAKVMYC